jgi:hypothetical protein
MKLDKMKNQSEMIIYQTEDGLTKVNVTFEEDTVWLTVDQMATLFQRDRSVIGKHVRSIMKDGELQKESVWANFAHTAEDGKTLIMIRELRFLSSFSRRFRTRSIMRSPEKLRRR